MGILSVILQIKIQFTTSLMPSLIVKFFRKEDCPLLNSRAQINRQRSGLLTTVRGSYQVKSDILLYLLITIQPAKFQYLPQMQSKEKEIKMLYAVGTQDISNLNQQHQGGNTQNISNVSKRQFKLYISDLEQFERNEDILQLTLVDQERSKTGHYQAIFTLKKQFNIKRLDIMINFPLSCIITANKLTIPQEEIRRMINQFKRLYQQEEDSEQYDSELSDNKSDVGQNSRGRGRPKGSKNKKKQTNGQQSSDQSYEQSEGKKEQKKPGKGRPKGSKNKKKDIFDDEISYESNFQTIFKKLFQHRSFEEINKRLNKDNKIKQQVVKLEDNYEDLQGKRARGRPKGVKNKKNKIQEQDSEQNVSFDPLPQREPLKTFPKCCSKCTQRENKKLYLEGKLKDISCLKNICENFGVEDTSNIVIITIKNNRQSALKQLLKILNNIQNQFLVPWDCNNRLQNVGYTIRTRRDYLVKNQKQMINALLQDRYVYRGKWWQIIGVDRILESIPHYKAGIQIYDILTKQFPELRQVFYQNIPTLIRCGNQALSAFLIEKVLHMEENNTLYGYSKDHLECLTSKKSEIQFKKSSMLKQSCTNNFCSPIHCAVINSNTDLLVYILKHISQFNVGDSLGRKPVHYAAALESTKALQIIHKHNNQQLTQMDKKKITPLMIAAEYGRYNIIKFILERVRDKQYINHKCDAGLSALHYATINQHQQCLAILLDDPLVNVMQQTKQRFSILHLAAGLGDKNLVKLITSKDIKCTWDNFRRSPLVIALRNHHNDIFFQLLKDGHSSIKRDYSNNTLLHYAAAYGNIELVSYLNNNNIISQIPNKKNFYPWQLAVLKGHYYCAQLLQMKQNKVIHFPQHHHLIYLLLKNPRGTKEYIGMIQYLLKANIYKLDYQYNNIGDTCLHLVCSISEKDYYEQRKRETSYLLPNQYQFMENILIRLLLENGADPSIVNEKNQKAVNLCIENENSVGIQLLLEEIPFDVQPQTKNNHFVYYLTHIACKGKNETKFVLEKLAQVDEKVLRGELKKPDCHGFQFLVFLMKNFTQTVHKNFKKNYLVSLETYPVNQRFDPDIQRICIENAFRQYVQHEGALLRLVGFLIQRGADPRSIVSEPKVEKENENYKRWGIQHFLMRFPSLVLLKTFMKFIDKNFNMQNSEGRTPLHLFCMWNRQGCLFNTFDEQNEVPYIDFVLSPDYDGEKCLQYLLENGLTSNILDINRSTPLLYAALNSQVKFILLLRLYGSSINNCNSLNQTPLIQIIKNKNKFTVQQIVNILSVHGTNADFRDLDERNALHHLVSDAKNFDTSPEIFKKLLSFGINVNGLDKYKRSPIFYCFIKIKVDQLHADEIQRKNDKVEILQTLLNCQYINLDIVDVYQKTPLHYACENNFFFSILYLIKTIINYDLKDSEGNTPLAICFRHRMLNQAALLIRNGVKYGQVFQNGKAYSYFQYAVNNLSVGICFMLLDHGYPLQKALEQVKNEAFKRVLRKKYVSDN